MVAYVVEDDGGSARVEGRCFIEVRVKKGAQPFSPITKIGS